MRIYNSLSKEVEEFVPLDEKRGIVYMYNCGPTVYDYAHVGNFRSFILADSLRRYLEYKGYTVKQVMNITDVGHIIADQDTGEDKVEAKAKTQKKTPEEIAEYYTKAFFDDTSRLNLLAASSYPRATDFISEMHRIICTLIERGHAYVVGKNVYYEVSSFPSYGKLSGNDLSSLQAGARLETNPEKRNPLDFSLWVEDKKHIMGWKSPWGSHGYPGWHIECSAMSQSVLERDTIDIHTGGEDNKFPHHECEIAQSEGSTGLPFSRFFVHASHLLVEGKKMSKSLGNFYTLRDLLEKGYSGNAIRYFLLSGHYRQNSNLTLDGLHGSEQAVARIQEFIYSLDTGPYGNDDLTQEKDIFISSFEKALDNDLNFPEALSSLFVFIEKVNKGNVSKESAREIKESMKKVNHVLGLLLEFEINIPLTVQRLVEERQKHRNMGDFKESDTLRKKIQHLGYDVRDSSDGPIVVKGK